MTTKKPHSENTHASQQCQLTTLRTTIHTICPWCIGICDQHRSFNGTWKLERGFTVMSLLTWRRCSTVVSFWQPCKTDTDAAIQGHVWVALHERHLEQLSSAFVPLGRQPLLDPSYVKRKCGFLFKPKAQRSWLTKMSNWEFWETS